MRQRLFNRYLSRALVVGRLEDVQYVIGQIHMKSGAAYNVVGAALEDAEIPRVTVGGREVPVLATTLATVAEAASRERVDAVIVAGQPRSGSDFIRSLAWQLEGSATELVLASRLTDVAGPRIHFRPVEGLPLIHVEIPQFEGGKHVLKRAMDIVASGLALIVLMPLMLVIALLIRWDSHGPVLFKQERVGRNGQTFMMLKFRSMVETAERDLDALKALNEGAGVLFKMKNDPRITRVGRVLRKYSLDELPQLWNVFIGDMSLVGPRPPLEREVEGYARHVRRRLYIKPGLTGMWQVNGRSDLSWEESVRLDLYYVENWSVMGDLLIMWRTLKVLTHPVGAY
jgi:exopolysaccharide biosynthesis polyprenyl glycosylphosphotransferase